jgi:hypothetical protein
MTMGWLILIAVIVGAAIAWKYRVKIAAKVLGQPEHRIQRAIERRRQNRG